MCCTWHGLPEILWPMCGKRACILGSREIYVDDGEGWGLLYLQSTGNCAGLVSKAERSEERFNGHDSVLFVHAGIGVPKDQLRRCDGSCAIESPSVCPYGSPLSPVALDYAQGLHIINVDKGHVSGFLVGETLLYRKLGSPSLAILPRPSSSSLAPFEDAVVALIIHVCLLRMNNR